MTKEKQSQNTTTPDPKSDYTKSENVTVLGRKWFPEFLGSESRRNNSIICKQKQESSNTSEDKCMTIYSEQTDKQSTMKDNFR